MWNLEKLIIFRNYFSSVSFYFIGSWMVILALWLRARKKYLSFSLKRWRWDRNFRWALNVRQKTCALVTASRVHFEEENQCLTFNIKIQVLQKLWESCTMYGLLCHDTLDTSTPTNQVTVVAYLWKAVFPPSFYLPTAYSTAVQFFLSDIIEAYPEHYTVVSWRNKQWGKWWDFSNFLGNSMSSAFLDISRSIKEFTLQAEDDWFPHFIYSRDLDCFLSV